MLRKRLLGILRSLQGVVAAQGLGRWRYGRLRRVSGGRVSGPEHGGHVGVSCGLPGGSLKVVGDGNDVELNCVDLCEWDEVYDRVNDGGLLADLLELVAR